MFLKFINKFNLNINKPSCSGIKDQNWWSNKGPCNTLNQFDKTSRLTIVMESQ